MSHRTAVRLLVLCSYCVLGGGTAAARKKPKAAGRDAARPLCFRIGRAARRREAGVARLDVVALIPAGRRRAGPARQPGG